ncbi:MAG: MFS transporter [Dehalococcoidia bacterium]|nr:MFS transporter [Dehalococcoidia bacterium]
MQPPTLVNVSGVLRNRPFLFLWIAQALSQTALNATVYTLLVQVQQNTGSSTALGLLILSFILPSVAIGVPAGVFVDRWRKKRVLVITNVLRAGIVACFALVGLDFYLILALNLAYSVVSQFFAPAEVAAIPVLVPKDQLIVANGLFNITMSGAQLMGFVIIGPILIKSFGGPSVYLSLAAVYLLCSGLIWSVRLAEPELKRSTLEFKRGWVRPVAEDLHEGWRLLAGNNGVSVSILHLILMNSLVLIIGMLAPGYVSRVLGIGADDSVFIMAPAGFGMLAGIAGLPQLAARWAKEAIANFGIVATGSVLLLLGLVGQLGILPRGNGEVLLFGWFAAPEQTGPVLVVMGLAFLLGVGYSLVNVAAQTLVQERTPLDLQGRIFAAQFAISNTAAIIPLLFLGSLADLVGVSEVTIFGAIGLLVAGGFSVAHTRRLSAVPMRVD